MTTATVPRHRLPSTIERIGGGRRYAIALALTTLALGISYLLPPSRVDPPPMTVPLLAVIACGYLEGMRLGLVSTALVAIVTSPLVFDGQGADPRADIDRWLCALAAGVLVSFTSEALHRATRRQRDARDRAEAALRDEILDRERRANDARRSSEALFARAFHASPVPKCITHLDSGRYVEVNDAYLRMCGYRRAELLGRTSRELGLIEPGVRDAMLADLAAHTPIRSRDVELHTRGGDVRHLLTNAEPIDLDGEPHLLTASVDITERLAAEAEAREQAARFRQLAGHIRQVFYLFDREHGHMLYCSPAYEAIWGRTIAELDRSPAAWIEAIHRDDRARIKARYADPPAGPHADVYRIVTASGDVRWIEDRKFPILDEDGRVVQVSGVADDITDRRLLEEQVRHSQKMESVGALAGGVAHDFNNVLTIVLSCAELLQRDATPFVRELVDDILTAVTRASALTRQLLVFSRREVVEPRILDLNGAVVDAEKMLRRLIGEDVVLETALASGLGPVKIDPSHLLQAIMNLVVNARDAMPRGGRLTIATRDVDAAESVRTLLGSLRPGRYAMLSVTDTGSGMPPEIQSRVFEPFFTTKPAGKGTGMGLAVLHGIVHQAGGLIDLYSEVGVGTTFAIYLPCDDSDADRTGERRAVAPGGSEAVLLVEDADDVRRITARALEALGYAVLQASGGDDGLALLAKHPEICLLVTDVVMPGMDGRELAEAATRARPDLPILYTSGYTDDAVLHHGVEAAQVAFLQKPFTREALARKVRDVLERATSSSS